jgi:hypothetical protein
MHYIHCPSVKDVEHMLVTYDEPHFIKVKCVLLSLSYSINIKLKKNYYSNNVHLTVKSNIMEQIRLYQVLIYTLL